MSTFKVGDAVRCTRDGVYPLTVGGVYTIESIEDEFLRVTDDLGRLGGYSYTRFELAQEPVLTPEEVFEHLRKGTKLQFAIGSQWQEHSGNIESIKVLELISTKWRIKPVPEIIEANGRKYKLIEE